MPRRDDGPCATVANRAVTPVVHHSTFFFYRPNNQTKDIKSTFPTVFEVIIVTTADQIPHADYQELLLEPEH